MIKLVWSRSLGWNLDNQKMKITQYITNGCDCYPWTETFIFWPRKSFYGTPLFWTKAYKRRVWAVWGTGFHMEPEVQYITLEEMLKYGNPQADMA